MEPEALKALRKASGLSLKQAAELVHVSTRTWARWESGSRHCPESVIELFCLKSGAEYKHPK